MTAMAQGHFLRSPDRPNRKNQRRQHYRLRDFVLIWILGMLALVVLRLLLGFPAGLIATPIVGLFVTRSVSKRVIWWNQANSLANVSRVKLLFVFAWPLALPVLIFQIAIAKWL